MGPKKGTQLDRIIVIVFAHLILLMFVQFVSERCKKVLETARKYNILVFCDDVYNLLHYRPGRAPKRLIAYDRR